MNKIESRHRLIRSIISEKKIRTQQELQDSLEANGIIVTQSTLSRDVKSLNLVKINEGDSSYYAINSIAPSRWENRLRFYMEDALVMLRPVQNQVVVKTLPGLASATMGIMAPLGEFVNVRPSLIITAYQSASGVLNLIAPTSGIVMGALALGRINIATWWKFMAKLVVAVIVITIALLLLGTFVPFL